MDYKIGKSYRRTSFLKDKSQEQGNILPWAGRLEQESWRRIWEDTSWYSHSLPGDTKDRAVFLFLFMLCPWLSLLTIWSVASLAASVVLHHWYKLGLVLRSSKLYPHWAVLSKGAAITPSPRSTGIKECAKLGPSFFTGNDWDSADCHVCYNGTFTSKLWITTMGNAHRRSGPEFGD